MNEVTVIIMNDNSSPSLRKVQIFHLISWCGNFVKRHSFWANCPKLSRNYAFPQNFQIRKLGEITVFYAVRETLNYS